MKCEYCGKDLTLTSYPYYALKKSIYPKGYPFRWVTVGFVCDGCEKDGKPLRVKSEFDELPK